MNYRKAPVRMMKFRHPASVTEARARMIVLEDLGPRTLVLDLAFIADGSWRFRSTSEYATADLVDDQCPRCDAPLYKGTCINEGDFENEEDRNVVGALWLIQLGRSIERSEAYQNGTP